MSKIESIRASKSVGFFWRPGIPGDRRLHGISYRRLPDGVTCVCDGHDLERLVTVTVLPTGTKVTSSPLANCDFFTWSISRVEGDLDRDEQLRLWHNFVNKASRQLMARLREKAGKAKEE